jgi:2-oxoglutarate dehydrogenase E2 component (dihydrolipoamide succinyltransferase)
MSVELKVPSFGESVSEVVIASWLRQPGDVVKVDESLAELESDKATVELPAPTSGMITKLLKQAGDSALVGEVIGYIDSAATSVETEPKQAGAEPANLAGTSADPAGLVAASNGQQSEPGKLIPASPRLMPAAERLMAERGLSPADMVGLGSGPGGRVLKEDVLKAGKSAPSITADPGPGSVPVAGVPDFSAGEDIVPMSPIRKKIAARLVESQQQMAILTTFNEIDMSRVMELRKTYQEQFSQKHGVKLGFMSFFVKASIEALKQFPQVNAELRDSNIVYKNYYDIGIAVGGGKGLVVPVLRSAERMSFAETELAIADYGKRAQENKLALEEFTGGTFTISNGGVYGSLMSTPIINPPQVAILGLHAIQERPVVRDGQIVARPMMYVALSYDHRLIDGRESVTFLRCIKNLMEDPVRLLLEV